MGKEVVKEISPWGVQSPFLILAAVYFTLSLAELVKRDFTLHGYFAMVATYSLLSGMLMRLFFPATKYLPLHLLTLVALALPFPLSQVASMVFLTAVEVWALRDVRSYGSKFPVNLLVLSSPVAGIFAWLGYYFTGHVAFLLPPIVMYVLGINVGLFAATLRSKPFFWAKQLPFLILSALSFFQPLYAIDTFAYSVYFLATARSFRSPSLLVLVSFLASSVLSFENLTHSVLLGLMLPSFVNCVVYSIARYNYGTPAHWLSLSALLASLVSWFAFRELSALLTLISVVTFYALIVHNFHPVSVKLGISVRFLRKPINPEPNSTP